MYRILRLIFMGTWELPKKCKHNWEGKATYDAEYPSGRVDIKIVHQCTKCGELKTFSMNA